MKDHFFDLVDARGELAASRVTLENLVRAIETDLPETREFLLDVSLKLAKEQLVAIQNVLDKDIHS